MPTKRIQVIFRQIGGIWQNVNEEKPRTFADFLNLHNLIFDDKTHFVRYKIYANNKHETNHEIEIRCYGGQIRCDILPIKEK